MQHSERDIERVGSAIFNVTLGELVASEEPVIELGLFNSMSLLSMLSFIEKQLGVVIPREDIKPENVTDLATIADLVRRNRKK